MPPAGCGLRLPTIGILFYGGSGILISASQRRAIVSSLRKANIIPVYSDGINNLHAMRRFFFLNGQPITDALCNLTMFRLNGGPLGGNHHQEFSKRSMLLFTPASMPKERSGIGCGLQPA